MISASFVSCLTRKYERVERHDSGGTHGHSLHWQVEVGGTSMEEVRGASFAGSSPPFLGRERTAVDVDVGPERRPDAHRCS